MDIHRARFVPYPPSAVNCLAFSQQPNLPGSKHSPATRLAVGRANGDIELWNPSNGNWMQETIFRGGRDRSVEGLVWTEEPVEENDESTRDGGPVRRRKLVVRPRLFSVGCSAAVTEWDMATGLPSRHVGAHNSEAWCIAAQPPDRMTKKQQAGRKTKQPRTASGSEKKTAAADDDDNNDDAAAHSAQHIVVGHADGTISLLSTGNDDLAFVRIVGRPTKKKARVLSLAFQSRNIVVAGYSDSAIRLFDISTSTLIRTIHLGAAVGGAKELLVWSVACLQNGQIVSGDSSGEIRLWHGTRFFQMQALVGHNADVLAVAGNRDGTVLFSTGMDRRLTVYESEVTAAGVRRFHKVSHSRIHDHDVKSIATFESRDISVVITGGLDAKLMLSPLRNRVAEVHFAQSALPQIPPLASVPAERLVCAWWQQELSIWRIGRVGGPDHPYQLLSRFQLSGDENITSATLTSDGKIVVVATNASVRAFGLRLVSGSGSLDADPALMVRKLTVPADLAGLGARLVRFSPVGRWLAAVRPDNSVVAVSFGSENGAVGPVVTLPRLVRNTRLAHLQTQESVSLGTYLRTINRLEFSPDGRALVVSDLSGWIDSWFLDGEQSTGGPVGEVVRLEKKTVDSGESAFDSDSDSDSDDEGAEFDDCNGPWTSRLQIDGQTWIQNPKARTTTKLISAAILLSFRPQQTDGSDDAKRQLHLFAVTAKHHFIEMDLESGQLTAWTRRNPSANLPDKFQMIRSRAIGCLWQLDRVGGSGDAIPRFWIWGHSWLFMFDFSQDFVAPIPADPIRDPIFGINQARKRQLSAISPTTPTTMEIDTVAIVASVQSQATGDQLEESSGRDKNGVLLHTGAGGSTHKSEMSGVKTDGIVHITGPELTTPTEDISMIDPDHEPTTEQPVETETETEGGLIDQVNYLDSQKHTPFWRTFKYRPIFGIVPIHPLKRQSGPLTPPNSDPGCLDGPIEVVLVERPDWDIKLPSRLVGTHEHA